MKDKIYNIPVTDALKEGGECPFCCMYSKLEQEAVEYMLGPSYMEADIRMDTNEIGFCNTHYDKMYEKQNRLGLALMLHTHLQKINYDLNSIKNSAQSTSGHKKSFFSKHKVNSENNTLQTIDYLNKIQSSCYICNRVDSMMQNYIDTFLFMWKKEKGFADSFKQDTESKGFCIQHFSMLLSAAEKYFTADLFNSFVSTITEIQLQNLKRLEDELDWFIKKSDYRYNDEPWKTSKDVLPRAILKISGN